MLFVAACAALFVLRLVLEHALSLLHQLLPWAWANEDVSLRVLVLGCIVVSVASTVVVPLLVRGMQRIVRVSRHARQRFKLQQQRKGDGQGCECAVCLEVVAADDEEHTAVLLCGHMFHECCIRPWVLAHGTCPVCRAFV